MKILNRSKERILFLYSTMPNPIVSSSFTKDGGLVWVSNKGGTVIYEFVGDIEECLELLYNLHKNDIEKQDNNKNNSSVEHRKPLNIV